MKKRHKPRMSPAMMAAMMAPPPAAAGPPPGMGGAPPMGMKKGGKVTMLKNKGDGVAKKGKTATRDFEFARGGAVRGGGAESKGKTRGRFV